MRGRRIIPVIVTIIVISLTACSHKSALELEPVESPDGSALNITIVDIGGFPQFLCAADGYVWGIGGRPRFWKLDERTNAFTGIPIHWPDRDEITGFAVGEGSIWISNYPPLGVAQRTVRYDAQTGEEQAIIEAGGAIAVGEGSLWALDRRAGLLRRADAQTNSITKAIAVRPGPRRVLVENGSVWLLGIDDGVLTRINPQTDRVESDTIAGEPHDRGLFGFLLGGDTGFYSGMCVTDEAAWVTDNRATSSMLKLSQPQGTIARVNLADLHAASPREAGRWPMSPVEFAGSIWFTAETNSARLRLVQVDPRTGHIVGVHELPRNRAYRPGSSITLVQGESALWAGSDGAMQRIEIE